MKQHPHFPSPEELMSSSWRGISKNPLIVVHVTQSHLHSAHFHYSADVVADHARHESRRPVSMEWVELFVLHLLRTNFCTEIEWTKCDRKPPDFPQATASAECFEVVYFIKGGPFLKIGKGTFNGTARMRAFETGNPYELELVGHIKGGLKEERELHKRFAEYRFRPNGEWFRLEGELADYIATLAVSQ